MDHSNLPSVRNASLPASYEAAKLAILECSRIDECKDWADKAQALASYARQSEDMEMEKTACRIRARAIRRCGELLKEVEKQQGARTDKLGGSDSPKLETRKTAAKEAGMSTDLPKTGDATRYRCKRMQGEKHARMPHSRARTVSAAPWDPSAAVNAAAVAVAAHGGPI